MQGHSVHKKVDMPSCKQQNCRHNVQFPQGIANLSISNKSQKGTLVVPAGFSLSWK